jgi:hypothetical protein
VIGINTTFGPQPEVESVEPQAEAEQSQRGQRTAPGRTGPLHETLEDS